MKLVESIDAKRKQEHKNKPKKYIERENRRISQVHII